ncbi:MAG: prepilin-type N-terminal cleavage/methylation domain-containing protein [Pirellulales bacterium]|nr:prepilin-type N-terminal cleavage/methylation domain-containing protein [Pirellulales bacterium]
MGDKYRDSTRRGLTLIEVMLVLALMVVIASFCWPALSRAFSSQRLKKAADIVCTQWSKARIKAMSENCIVLFYYEMDGGRFRIRQLSDMDSLAFSPDAAAADSNAALGAVASGSPAAESAGGSSDIINYSSPDGVQSLPKGIVFRAGQIENDSRASTADVGQVSNLSSDVLWSAPIFFYPDGTSSSVRLQICNDRNLGLELALRGMTGVARVSDIGAAEGAVP